MKRKMSVQGISNVKEASLSASVIRCGCSDLGLTPDAVHPGTPCPTPKQVEDRGVISYYNRNPFKMLVWGIKQGWREGRGK